MADKDNQSGSKYGLHLFQCVHQEKSRKYVVSVGEINVGMKTFYYYQNHEKKSFFNLDHIIIHTLNQFQMDYQHNCDLGW